MIALRELLNDLRTASRSQVALRATMVLALLVFGLLLYSAGTIADFAFVVLGILGLLTACVPTGPLPAAVLLYCVTAWWTGVPHEVTWETLGAALALLCVHLTCGLAGSVPAQAELPDGILREYAVRLGVVVGATVLVWGAAVLQTRLDLPGGVPAVAIGTGAVALVLGVHYVLVTRREG